MTGHIESPKTDSIDMEPVVRCRDCVFKREAVTMPINGEMIKCVTGRYHSPDWYCADGIREHAVKEG